MPVLFELVRESRIRLVPDAVRNEVRKAYDTLLWPESRKDLEGPLQGWAALPKFTHKTSVARTVWSYSVYVDRSTKIGDIYQWVDQGTGLEGPKQSTYVIEPVDAPMLQFQVPYQPSTFPSAPLRYTPGPPTQWISSGHIDHPGIQARNFSRKAFNKLKDPRNRKGFRVITKNAIIRGFRKVIFGR